MRAEVLFHLLVKVFFQSRKGAAAYDVLDFAGVVCRGFLVDAEPDEEFAEDGVTLVCALSDLKSCLGEMKSAVVGNGDIAAVAENSDRTADAMVSRYISPDSFSCIKSLLNILIP